MYFSFFFRFLITSCLFWMWPCVNSLTQFNWAKMLNQAGKNRSTKSLQDLTNLSQNTSRHQNSWSNLNKSVKAKDLRKKAKLWKYGIYKNTLCDLIWIYLTHLIIVYVNMCVWVCLYVNKLILYMIKSAKFNIYRYRRLWA